MFAVCCCLLDVGVGLFFRFDFVCVSGIAHVCVADCLILLCFDLRVGLVCYLLLQVCMYAWLFDCCYFLICVRDALVMWFGLACVFVVDCSMLRSSCAGAYFVLRCWARACFVVCSVMISIWWLYLFLFDVGVAYVFVGVCLVLF